MVMKNAAEELTLQLKKERKEVLIHAFLTSVTLVALIVGFGLQFTTVSTFVIGCFFSIAYLAGGARASVVAVKNIFRGKLDINLLMVVAALAAAFVGEVRDGAILLFLFSLSGTLEGYAMGSTKRAVVALMRMRPEEAYKIITDEQIELVAVETLLVSDRVLIKPGERFPIDGIIESGSGPVDQSPITGESVPVEKTKGEAVFAGSINGNAVLVVTVTKLSQHSTLARMIELVTQAQSERSPSERFSDWFGQRYTFIVFFGSFIALGVFLLLGFPSSVAFYKVATLLVVASPCAIVISVPAAVLSALAASARVGVLFKGGAALEDFGTVHTIAFDKTGTLTQGKMEVVDVIGVEATVNTVLAVAGALEAQSEHPLAKSIVRYIETLHIGVLSVSSVTALPGKGIEAKVGSNLYWAGNKKMLKEHIDGLQLALQTLLESFELKGQTTIIVGQNTTILGVIGIADIPRKSASVALAELKKMKVKQIVMLTGDTMAVAKSVALPLGIPEDAIFADLLPEDKVACIKKLQESGKVAFVGDGINDAAALATATVGIAMGTAGSDVAIEAADVALLSDDLQKLVYARGIAYKANIIIKQNLIFAVGIMILMVGITLFGNLPLPLGVIGHEGGTLLVVANGLRLLFAKK